MTTCGRSGSLVFERGVLPAEALLGRGSSVLVLFERRITRVEDTDPCEAIDVLAEKLLGHPIAMFYGANAPAR